MSKVKYIQDNNDYDILIDKETGVNYIAYYGYDTYAITPRLNADGTLYVSKTTTREGIMLKKIRNIVNEVE